MIKEIRLRLDPDAALDIEQIKRAVKKEEGLSPQTEIDVLVKKRSIDARQKRIKYNLSLEVNIGSTFKRELLEPEAQAEVSSAEEVHIIGAGPAGYFAALRCIELGKKPVLFERGKDVRERIKDIKAINTQGVVGDDSNYCFGEGGAGTYSDGKLYTRSKKRGDVSRVLDLLVAFGAHGDIRVDAHPHIGSNKLPAIIASMRDYIKDHGGEIHFSHRLTDIEIQAGKIKGLSFQNGAKCEANQLILATGHSARDIFELLKRKNLSIKVKPLAIGVRLEHPQDLIDSIQYHCKERGPYLPPAPYSLVKQINDRGIYSFCMCPGGVIAPCATAPAEVVTNGWSSSSRAGGFANSGIVVEVGIKDLTLEGKETDAFAALELQRQIEQRAFQVGGGEQKVPAQRLVDFCTNKISQNLPKSSYPPGTTSAKMEEVFPGFIVDTLRAGLLAFGKQMKGYYSKEAVLHAPESRTSSPVQVPRDKESLQHPEVEGLYPCGEGAGYAGGIVSAAIDGMKCAERACIRIKV